MDDADKSLVSDDDINKMIGDIKGAPVPPTPTLASPIPNGAIAGVVNAPNPLPSAPILPNDAVPVPSNLDSIKQDALSELRPLVDRLELSPEDKFDTLLLIIRSTDDSSLLPAAHAAAKQIADDARRAQALLDVIKEIDFFKQQK
jgi:hypothetical protein